MESNLDLDSKPNSQVRPQKVNLVETNLPSDDVEVKVSLKEVNEEKRPKPVVVDDEEVKRQKWADYDRKKARLDFFLRMREAKGTYEDPETKQTIVKAGNLYVEEIKKLEKELNALANELNG